LDWLRAEELKEEKVETPESSLYAFAGVTSG
jgi:hypothetical protein